MIQQQATTTKEERLQADRDYSKAYYKRNKETISTKRKAYYKANQETMVAKQVVYDKKRYEAYKLAKLTALQNNPLPRFRNGDIVIVPDTDKPWLKSKQSVCKVIGSSPCFLLVEPIAGNMQRIKVSPFNATML